MHPVIVLLSQLLIIVILGYFLARFVNWLQSWVRNRREEAQIKISPQGLGVVWEPLPVSAPDSPPEVREEPESWDWQRSTSPPAALVDDVHRALAVIISETRRVDYEKCVPSARLFVELGLESIDFLEISFRMDEEFGFHYPINDLASFLISVGEGSSSDDVERALERLRTDLFMTVPADLEGVQPFDTARLREAVLELVTVQSLYDYVIGMRKRDDM